MPRKPRVIYPLVTVEESVGWNYFSGEDVINSLAAFCEKHGTTADEVRVSIDDYYGGITVNLEYSREMNNEEKAEHDKIVADAKDLQKRRAEQELAKIKRDFPELLSGA